MLYNFDSQMNCFKTVIKKYRLFTSEVYRIKYFKDSCHDIFLGGYGFVNDQQ